jgi:hypothetical protein
VGPVAVCRGCATSVRRRMEAPYGPPRRPSRGVSLPRNG